MARQLELPQGRVRSIDALRGFDMFWIIGGDVFFRSLLGLSANPVIQALERQLHHVDWHGFRFYDMIFPLFLFLVGICLPFSLTKRIERGESKRDIFIHVLKRTALIYFLGLCYYGLFDLDLGQLRYGGVLQRIALSYFFASVIVLSTNIRGQIAISAAILLVYWGILALVPAPSVAAGSMLPDVNIGAWFDNNIIPGKKNMYGLFTGDSTSLFSTPTATVSAMMGVLSGHWLRSNAEQKKKAAMLALAGTACIAAALLWNTVFPINKFLWTSSFVLLAGGWSMILMSLFYWIIDVKGYVRWSFPFMVIGLNALTIFVAERFISFHDIAGIFVHGFAGYTGAWEPVVWGASILAVEWFFLYFLYKHKIFLKA
ncbi:acyltransferase family protein [Candidatus Latescibacterota bacterium]